MPSSGGFTIVKAVTIPLTTLGAAFPLTAPTLPSASNMMTGCPNSCERFSVQLKDCKGNSGRRQSPVESTECDRVSAEIHEAVSCALSHGRLETEPLDVQRNGQLLVGL